LNVDEFQHFNPENALPKRATSMGLDINRADFLRALNKVAGMTGDQSTVAVIFGR
jgi:hypothetical protein